MNRIMLSTKIPSFDLGPEIDELGPEMTRAIEVGTALRKALSLVP